MAKTPNRYIAFLRAINVGSHTVRMADLRALFAALGYTNVATFIASGNVIFDSPSADARALEDQIEQHLEAELGYAVATFMRTAAQVATIASYQPFAADDAEPGTLYIAFVAAPPSPAACERVLALNNAVDDLHIHDREIYWLRRADRGESKLSGAVLERALGCPATVRNSNTVKRLAAKYPPEATL